MEEQGMARHTLAFLHTLALLLKQSQLSKFLLAFNPQPVLALCTSPASLT